MENECVCPVVTMINDPAASHASGEGGTGLGWLDKRMG